MKTRTGLGTSSFARRAFAPLKAIFAYASMGALGLVALNSSIAQEYAAVQRINSGASSAGAAQATTPAPYPEYETPQPAQKRGLRRIFGGNRSPRSAPTAPARSEFDAKTGKRYLPTMDPTQANAEPSLESQASMQLRQFAPSANSAPQGSYVPPDPGEAPTYTAPKDVNYGKPAYNPKFETPIFQEDDRALMADALIGEMTPTGAILKQFEPTEPRKTPEEIAAEAEIVKQAIIADREQAAELKAAEVAKRTSKNDNPAFNPKFGMPTFDPLPDRPDGVSDEMLTQAGGILTQFAPTEPITPVTQEEIQRRADIAGGMTAEAQARKAEASRKAFSEVYGTESGKEIPTMTVDTRYTEVALSDTSRQLTHFDVAPPENPKDIRFVSAAAPADAPAPRGGLRKVFGGGGSDAVDPAVVAQELADEKQKAYTAYYNQEEFMPMPTLDARVWQDENRTYLEGGPTHGGGRPLKPFGQASNPNFQPPQKAGLFGQFRRQQMEVDVSEVAETERLGEEGIVVAEVSEPAPEAEPTPPREPGPPIQDRSLLAVAKKVGQGIKARRQARPGLFPEESMPDPEAVEEMPGEEVGEAAGLDETPIIDKIRGIELASAWKKNRMNEEAENPDDVFDGLPTLENDDLVIDPDLEVPEEVRLMFAGHIGEPLSLASLDGMLRDAISGYQGSDLPVVDIAIPEQEVTDGILRLDVLEARQGNVLVENAQNPAEELKGTDPEYLTAQISTDQGDKLQSSSLLKDIAWLNRYPFRRVDLVYTPGENFGETDLIMRTVSVRPWLFYTSADNTGNELLGDFRTSSALTIGSPFGLDDHLLAYQFSADTDFDHLMSHSLAYSLPVYWNKIRPQMHQRHYLTLIGAFASVESDVFIDGQQLSLDGFSGQASMRYLLPLPRKNGVTREFEIGIDWKTSNNNLQFNTLEVFDTTTHIYQVAAGWNSRYEQFLGLMGFATLDIDVVFSPGGLDENNSDEIFESARGGARAQYAYGRAAAEWHLGLDRANMKDWTLVSRLTGQLASNNLLATETLGAGGLDDVRGFEERIVRGDRGLVGGVELRTPEMEVPSFIGWGGKPRPESWQGLVFYDAAWLQNVDPLEGESNSISLSSSGIGMRYEFDRIFSFQIDYGWVIDASGFDVEDQGRAHARGRITF